MVMKVKPGVLDLEIYPGDARTYRLTLKNKATGELLELPTTGWSAQIRESRWSPSVVASFTIDATGAGSGVVRLTPPTDLEARLYVWALKCADAVRTYITGTLDVTHA